MILRRPVGDRGANEVSRPLDVERGRWAKVETPTVDSRRAAEVDHLRVEAVAHQVAGSPTVIGVDREVRHARIGPVLEQQRAVDRLILLRHARDVPMEVAIRKHGAPVEEGRARTLRAGREVLEILGVTDVLAIERQTEVARQLRDIHQLDAAAARAIYAIVGQVVPGELAMLSLREITEITTDVRPAAGVLRRLEGEVDVGS